MRLDILTAETALTKTFYADGSIEPYPFVKNFVSNHIALNDIETFYETLKTVAECNGALLKGHLTETLDNAPRAGKHDTTALTEWMLIDYDLHIGFASITDLLTCIDPALAKVDYIFQHSASAGVRGPVGLRGHVFILLEDPVSPNVIKQWLRHCNLTCPELTKHITLSRNAMALRFPLDITTCQNDKIIYVAPPIFIGMEDPVANRFVLVKGEARKYKFTASISTEQNKIAESALLQQLQDCAGLEPRAPKYALAEGQQILQNPIACTVTSLKKCGEYTRLNLNGGDSFAYWYHNASAEILYNFKGESPAFIKDIAPEYYQQLQIAHTRQSYRPLVFRDVASDTFYNAEYDEVTGRLVMLNRVKQRQTLSDFLVQRGAPALRVIPDWDLTFDPLNSLTIDFENRILNRFIPTVYFDAVPDAAITTAKFPTIDKIVAHLCVDASTREHFYNWVAHILQFRVKTQTAWVFSGVEGTGKGVLFSRILSPLFGASQCVLVQQDNLEEKFNGFLDNNLIMFVDEGDVESSRDMEKVMAKLRTVITEPILPIRNMFSDVQHRTNYTNVIVASNKMMPIKPQATDRRWNIAPRQHQKIVLTDEELFVHIPNELPSFSKFLKARAITKNTAKQVLENATKTQMLDMSRTVAEDFFIALRAGNLDFFAEQLQENIPLNDRTYIPYAQIIVKWMQAAVSGSEVVSTVQDLLDVYHHISGSEALTQKKFSHLAGRFDFKATDRVRIKGVQRWVYTLKFANKEYENWLLRNEGAKNNITKLVKR